MIQHASPTADPAPPPPRSGAAAFVRRHLRLRLVLWILLIPAPPLLLTLWFAQRSYSDLADRMQESADLLAGQTATMLGRILYERDRDSLVFSALPAVRSLDRARLPEVLDQVVEGYHPRYRLILVADAHGKVLAVGGTTGPAGAERRLADGASVAEEPWFREAMAWAGGSGPPPITAAGLAPDPFLRRLAGDETPLLRLSLPIRSPQGAVQAVWAAWVNGRVFLDVLRASSNAAGRGAGLAIGLFDREGRPLGFSVHGPPGRLDRPLVERPVPHGGLGWTVRVYADHGVAGAQIPWTIPMLGAVLACIVGGAVLLGWLTTRHILAPLERLAAEAAGPGSEGARFTVEPARQDAIGTLQRALAAMTAQLETSAAALRLEVQDRRQSEREAQALAEQNRRLVETGLLLMRQLSLDELLRAIVEQGCALLQVRYGVLGLVGEDGGVARFIPVGVDEATAARIGAPPSGRGLLGLALGEGVLRVDRIAAHPMASGYPAHHPPMESLLAVRVASRTRVIGRLYFADTRPSAFTEGDERLILTLASLAAAAIENAVLFEANERQRRRVEAAEREARTVRVELETLLAEAPDLIVFTDPEGVVTRFNRGAEQLLGWREAEMVGRPAGTLYARPEDRAGLVAEVVARGHVVGREVRLRGKDGRVVDVSLTLMKLPDQGGRSAGMVGFGRDITDMKRLERALRASNEELEHFTYTISHDLQTPLRGIHGFADLLLRRAEARLEPKEVHYLQRMQAGADRMAALINDLLELSRVGRVQNAFEDCAMDELVAEARAELAPLIKRSGALLQVEEPLPVVRGDRVRLVRVWANLLSNALKYAKPGEAPSILVGALGPRPRDGGEEWAFFVRDRGIGIPPEYHTQVFEVFRRLHTHEQYEGTGAGLAIVKRIIEFHQGRIWVESVEGEGSTFWFTLPARVEDRSQPTGGSGEEGG
jgi:PAS domain S-box-containing protein